MATNIVVSCQFNFQKNILVICDFIYIFKMFFFFLAHPVHYTIHTLQTLIMFHSTYMLFRSLSYINTHVLQSIQSVVAVDNAEYGLNINLKVHLRISSHLRKYLMCKLLTFQFSYNMLYSVRAVLFHVD